ncbi:hypothetical protein C0991_002873 [Blastosporella zonata]|nr:hypothetical protein C0991_002873 [Blastosporella zonata]
MLQPLKEDPPSNSKCKDKFLIQSTLITPEKDLMNLAELWNFADTTEEGKIHQQKLRVAFLPAEGQTLEEEDEPNPYETTHQHHSIDDGHAQRMPDFTEPPPPQRQEVPVPRPLTPVDFSVAREDSHDFAPEIPVVRVASASDLLPESPARPEASQLAAAEYNELEYAPEPSPAPIHVPVPEPTTPESISVPLDESAPPPARAPAPIPVPVQEPYNSELAVKYEEAQQEIERLRSILANLEEPAVSEIRRRRPAMSDDGMSVAETDVQTAFGDDSHFHQQEGVPLQVVVIIALGVFITTYLFF